MVRVSAMPKSFFSLIQLANGVAARVPKNVPKARLHGGRGTRDFSFTA
jgi:hypothetical protein